MYKRIIGIILASIMILAMIAACDSGGSGGDTTPDTQTPANTPSTSGGTETTTDDDDDDDAGDSWFNGYPMDVPGFSMSIYAANSFGMHASLATWEDSPFLTGLNEHVGLDIEWLHPPAGAGDEQTELQMMIVSGNLPDVIVTHQIMPDADRLIEEGVFQDLAPYIQQWAPNYYAVLQADPVRHAAMKTDAGRYHGFGFFREAGGWNDSFQGPLVREDWLEALNLPVPKTISDWDNTLRAFKDEYNATLITHWNRFQTAGFVAGAFGAYASTAYRLYLDPRTDTIELAQVQPEWKDYIEHMNMWWSEGLINQDLMTLDDVAVRGMMLNDESGLSFSAMSQITNWTLDAIEHDTGARWIGIPTPTADDGSISMVFGGPGITGYTAGITNSVGEDRMEVVMRMLDYAYSPEGNLYWNFGTEGVSWNMVNGVPTFSDLLYDDPNGISEAMQWWSGTVWGGPAIQATAIIVTRNLPVAVEANDTWFYSFPELAQKFTLPRGMSLNAAEASRAGELEGAIQTYVTEMAASYLIGNESTSNFDDFVENVERMGLQELLSLYQAAYERFRSR